MPDYVSLRGHQIYSYEWENDGEAVVLLHGGLSKTSSWDYILVPPLEDEFHIFAYDRTAHGFTGDQDDSLHFDFQTREAIAFLEDIVKEPAHLIGWSDGANIALMAAIARPDLVKSIVAIGANFHHSGVMQTFDNPEISEEDQAEYNLISPDAPHTLLEKTIRMQEIWESEPTLTLEEIATIQCPVLVLVGDDDIISHSHTVALFEALPLGQLAVIPGTSHAVVKEKPDLMNAVIVQFLEDLNYPATRMPIRRTNNQSE
ncbi:MAG: putative pimeloyl-ACP methyl ester carboxylesterase [Actinobacteria bacterium]|jgi:pimeloyl-ACP methyl ester carboxylesterase|nr:putative pimeloyl-ACP methyl ester carboxylesterase [Actinomycetota bacterium]